MGLKYFFDFKQSELTIKRLALFFRKITPTRFAGNVITYPTGDWYGNLQAAHLPKLLEHLDAGTVFWDHWRGRAGLSKEEQIHLFEASNKLSGLF